MVQPIEPNVYYPDSDGQPIAETDLHRQILLDLVFALTQWFRARDDVYVTGNLFLYYKRGDPKKVVCPDVFVAFGAPQRMRNTYQTWRDGPFPQIVIELASAGTRKQDLGPKRQLYERLGVLDYFVFDPHFDDEADEIAESAAPTGELMCFQRASTSVPFGAPRLVPPNTMARSDQLGLGLIIRGQYLRLVDEATGDFLPTPEELAAWREAEERAQALAEEVARLRALLDQQGER